MSKYIVLDASHGGYDSGNISNGLLEKDLTLTTVLHLSEILNNHSINVKLIRDRDVFVNGNDRKNFISDEQVELFISFHHNTHKNIISGDKSIIECLSDSLYQNAKRNYDKYVIESKYIIIDSLFDKNIFNDGYTSINNEIKLYAMSLAYGILKYLNKDIICTLNEYTNLYITSNMGVNVRNCANGEIIDRISFSENVKKVEEDGLWSKIVYSDGKTGYIPDNSMSKNKPLLEKHIRINSKYGANFRDSHGLKICTIPYNTEVELLSIMDLDISKIRFEGVIGYVNSNYLKF